MTIKELADKAITQIEKGRIAEALKLLEQPIASLKTKRLETELSLITSRYNRLRKDNQIGVVGEDSSNITNNQIVVALLAFINEVKEEYGDHVIIASSESLSSLTTKTGESVTDVKKQTKDVEPDFTKTKWWQWILAAAVILGIISAIVSILGININDVFGGGKPEISTATVTVIVKSKNDIPLPKKGTVYLNYGGAQIPKQINNNKEAIFTEVSKDYFQNDRKIKITFEDLLGEPYFAVNKDSIYTLQPNETIELLVGLKGLDKLYGIVKDLKTGAFIEGARVSVLNIEAYTDKNGWWQLDLKSPDVQRKFHTLRVSKEGYQNWDQANIPAQTDKEIAIGLKSQ